MKVRSIASARVGEGAEEASTMSECLFLGSASGVIGRRLAPLLVASGWRVVGTTLPGDLIPILLRMAVEPVVIDVFDADGLRNAMAHVRPSVVVHQLTALPPGLDPSKMREALERNARIRDEGTRNLVSAATDAGARRLIAQSIAFAYAAGPLPHSEDNPLDIDRDDSNGVTARGVASLARQVPFGWRRASLWTALRPWHGLQRSLGTGARACRCRREGRENWRSPGT